MASESNQGNIRGDDIRKGCLDGGVGNRFVTEPFTGSFLYLPPCHAGQSEYGIGKGCLLLLVALE